MEQTIYSVSQVNEYIKSRFDADGFLSRLYIRGEISNYKLYPSGHHYFTMKDEEGALRCVMFRTAASRLRFRPENGMKVIAMGRVSVFPRDGAYQLYCEALAPDGVGDLHVAFEQLKAKLMAEGLFAPEHKKPLPRFAHRIAIITSGAGAAVMDMLRILSKRYPLSKVMILPVRVQGAEAPLEIAGAIRYANRYQIADLIITGRGGGSMEDLWAFNDERVARAIYESEIPVISAVGHEPDVTIADFVADLRAATPSNGAELAVPDQNELRQNLLHAQARMTAAMQKKIKLSRQTLENFAQKRVLQSPENYIADKRLLLDHMHERMLAASKVLLANKKERYVRLAAKLDAMSPLKVLSRGYSVTRRADGTLLTAAEQVNAGDMIRVDLHEGHLLAQVQEETV
ncbi:MAG: exodeoxyribonuclease VII large subunit [Oscillospiraceae bacterium]|nr:exodeoxyribonuclease VII large subunit [Oscillospiraceae bacterium]MBQ5749087.1 exodeoxyribonuclease VII large subunit [Oscillospiraceae bacterium]